MSTPYEPSVAPPCNPEQEGLPPQAPASYAPPMGQHAYASTPPQHPHAQQMWHGPGSPGQPAMWYPQQQPKSRAWIWALVGALGAVGLSVAAFLIFNTASDPLRTLQDFPVESYLQNHESVLGTHFRAELVLDSELGGEIGKGRLFAFRSQTTGRLLPVLVPSALEQASFEKGQKYLLELQVLSGGVVMASQCRKS